MVEDGRVWHLPIQVRRTHQKHDPDASGKYFPLPQMYKGFQYPTLIPSDPPTFHCGIKLVWKFRLHLKKIDVGKGPWNARASNPQYSDSHHPPPIQPLPRIHPGYIKLPWKYYNLDPPLKVGHTRRLHPPLQPHFRPTCWPWVVPGGPI